MSNLAVIPFTANGSWTCPAGVFSVKTIGVPTVTKLVTNAIDTYFLCSDGFTYSWGGNNNGQLGNGTVITGASSPTQVLGSNSLGFVQLAPATGAGSDGMYGLTQGGVLYAWGDNGLQGALGVGNNQPTLSTPTLVVGSLTFSQIASGANTGYTVAIATNGAAYAWGYNVNGNLGNGTVTSTSSPVAVLGGLTFKQIVQIGYEDAGNTAIGLTPAGVAYGWGINTYGAVGNGSTTTAFSSPVLVAGGLTFTSLIGDINDSTCFGLTATGALYGW